MSSFFITMKKNIFLLAIFICFFVSCTTTETLLSNVSPEGGQIIFLRPFSVKTDSSFFKEVILDVTVHIKDGEVFSDPVLNYTVIQPIYADFNLDNLSVGFICDDLKVVPLQKKLLYKNILKNKQLEVRYTSTIDKDAFTVLLENREVCNVLFTDSDSYEEVISSKDLKERLFKLTIVM